MWRVFGTCSESYRHAQLASVSPAILLRKLPKSQKCLSGHWGVPPAGAEHHRLKGEATGTELFHRLGKHCRSALKSAGRHKMFCRSCNSQQQRTNYAWQGNSKHVCTKHIPHHVNDSMGHVPRSSDHQSRIFMRDGPKNQECNFTIKCMQTK